MMILIVLLHVFAIHAGKMHGSACLVHWQGCLSSSNADWEIRN